MEFPFWFLIHVYIHHTCIHIYISNYISVQLQYSPHDSPLAILNGNWSRRLPEEPTAPGSEIPTSTASHRKGEAFVPQKKILEVNTYSCLAGEKWGSLGSWLTRCCTIVVVPTCLNFSPFSWPSRSCCQQALAQRHAFSACGTSQRPVLELKNLSLSRETGLKKSKEFKSTNSNCSYQNPKSKSMSAFELVLLLHLLSLPNGTRPGSWRVGAVFRH